MEGTSKTIRELLEENAALKKAMREFEEFKAAHGRVEEVLRESEERFRSLVEATSDWIWEINSDGIYTYVSPNIKDRLGYEPDEVIGKTPFELMPKENAGQVGALFKMFSDSRQPFSGLENVNIGKDGREIVLETNGVPIFDARGNYMGYRGFDRDITERKRTEEVLRTSRLRLSEAMELAHIVYWEDDPADNLLLLNDAFYAFHGTTAEREGGYRMTREECAKRFIHPDDWQRFAETVDGNMKRKDAEFVSDFEHRAVRRDGQMRHVLTRMRFFRTGPNHRVKAYGTTQDITDRKKAEEKDRHSAELSAAIEMAGAVCHELNQPLQIISGHIDLLFIKNKDDQTRKTLEIISDQIFRIGTVTKRLMGLKKYSNRDYVGAIKITDIDEKP